MRQIYASFQKVQEYKLPVEGYELVSAEASNDQIAELLGMTFPVFTNTILFAQNTRGRTVTDFLDEDDTGKKEIFSMLFNLQGYEQACELVKPDFKKEKEALDSINNEIALRTLDLGHEEKTLGHLIQEKETFETDKHNTIKQLKQDAILLEHQLLVCDIEKKTQRLEKLISDTYTTEQNLKASREKEASLNQQLVALKQSITEKAGECERKKSFGVSVPQQPTLPPGNLKQYEKQRDEAQKKLWEAHKYEQNFEIANREVTGAHERLQEYVVKQSSIDEERAKLQKTIDDLTTCPTCSQDLTPVAKEKVVKEYTQRLSKLKDIDLDGVIKTYEQAQKRLEAFEKPDIKALEQEEFNAQAGIDRWIWFEKDLAKYQGIVDNLEKLEEQRWKEVAQLEQDIVSGYDKCKELQIQVDDASTEITTLEKTLLNLGIERDSLRVDIEVNILPLQQLKIEIADQLVLEDAKEFPQEKWLKGLEVTIDSLKKTLNELEQKKTLVQQGASILEQLVEAFGKEGVVAELLREYLPAIESKAAEYLSELTNNELQIEFKPEKQLKRKGQDGEVISRAQFVVEVTKQNGGTGYDLVSGSEQNKAALVVNWALSDLAYLHSNVSCNLRVYDEVFDGLDALSSERLAQCLIRRAQESHQLTLVVTHKQELDEVFEHKIRLKKVEGITQILAPNVNGI